MKLNKWLFFILPFFVWGSYMALPRGIRNNNPGNIRLGDNWQGMKESQSDKSFVQFESVSHMRGDEPFSEPICCAVSSCFPHAWG